MNDYIRILVYPGSSKIERGGSRRSRKSSCESLNRSTQREVPSPEIHNQNIAPDTKTKEKKALSKESLRDEIGTRILAPGQPCLLPSSTIELWCTKGSSWPWALREYSRFWVSATLEIRGFWKDSLAWPPCWNGRRRLVGNSPWRGNESYLAPCFTNRPSLPFFVT